MSDGGVSYGDEPYDAGFTPIVASDAATRGATDTAASTDARAAVAPFDAGGGVSERDASVVIDMDSGGALEDSATGPGEDSGTPVATDAGTRSDAGATRDASATDSGRPDASNEQLTLAWSEPAASSTLPARAQLKLTGTGLANVEVFQGQYPASGTAYRAAFGP